MFGKLLTLAAIPVRLAAAPIKMADDAIRGERDTGRDTLRYVLTGKQESADNVTDGFADFDDEE